MQYVARLLELKSMQEWLTTALKEPQRLRLNLRVSWTHLGCRHRESSQWGTSFPKDLILLAHPPSR